MKNYKVTRNLWLFSGFCFLISFVLNLQSSKSDFLPILNAVTAILMFINAYINHKKIIKHNKDKDNKY